LSDPGADLGTLPGGFSSEAYGIDALGEVVGIASTANDTAHAMLYTNQMWDLNSLIPANSGWVLERAYGVNDDLWITGDGYLNGVRTGFLLIPAVSTEDARQELMVVPEPSSLLLGGGALLFGWLVRRRAMLTAA
jgi:probable HAF family extracellular repeat protein